MGILKAKLHDIIGKDASKGNDEKNASQHRDENVTENIATSPEQELSNQIKQLSLEDINTSPDPITDFDEQELITYNHLKFRIPAEETFLSLPAKYADNRAQERNALGFKVSTHTQPVDFKSALLPCIVGPQLALQILENRVQVGDLQNASLPNETQWTLINTLRENATSPVVSDQGRDKLLDYYIQLLILEEKFPLNNEKSTFKFEFSWFDIIGEHKVITSNVNYEKAATLYNIASIYSIMGCQTAKMATPNSISLAAHYFQRAAGICQTIIGIASQVKMKSMYELSHECLSFFTALMMAQASECFFHKAVESRVSAITLAKVAAQVYDRYTALEVPAYITKHKSLKLWGTTIKTRAAIFHSLAHEHMPLKDMEGKKLREKLARINVAKDLLLEVQPKATPQKLAVFIQDYLASLESTSAIAREKMLIDLPSYGRNILVPIPRPATHLTETFPFENDFKTYLVNAFDCFPTVIGPVHSESIGLLFQESSNVCKPMKATLKEIIQGISPVAAKKNTFLRSLNIADSEDAEKMTKSITELLEVVKAVHFIIKRLQQNGTDPNVLLDIRGRLIKSAKSTSDYQNEWVKNIQPSIVHLNQVVFKAIVENPAYCKLQEKAQKLLQRVREYEELLNKIIAEAVVTQRSVHEVITSRMGCLSQLKNEKRSIEEDLNMVFNKVFTTDSVTKSLGVYKTFNTFKDSVSREEQILKSIANAVRGLEADNSSTAGMYKVERKPTRTLRESPLQNEHI